MDVRYRAGYRELYQNHWWWRAREAIILETLRRSEPPGGWGTVLDVGCGDGLFFDRLSELGEVDGIEPDGAFVSDTGRHRQRIHLAPFDEHFRPGKTYSLVLMLDVLEHLPDPVAALGHALALLGPGGALLITVPAFNLLWTNHDVINGHVTRYTKRSFRELARRAGLHLELERYFFCWTFPVKLATRVVERKLALEPSIPTVPPRWMNQALYRLCRLEQKTLGRLTIPFGSSLMVLGTKAGSRAYLA